MTPYCRLACLKWAIALFVVSVVVIVTGVAVNAGWV